MIRGSFRRPQFVVSKLQGLVRASYVSTPWFIIVLDTPTTSGRIFWGEFSRKLATKCCVASTVGL